MFVQDHDVNNATGEEAEACPCNQFADFAFYSTSGGRRRSLRRRATPWIVRWSSGGKLHGQGPVDGHAQRRKIQGGRLEPHTLQRFRPLTLLNRDFN